MLKRAVGIGKEMKNKNTDSVPSRYDQKLQKKP